MWLLAKACEIDPLVCPRCGWEMKGIAVIQDPVDIRDILAHLVKAGLAPPGFDPALLNWQTLELHLMRRLGQVCTRPGGEMLEPRGFCETIDLSKNGSVWIGKTSNGAYLFDGSSWRQYTTADGLIADSVTSICFVTGRAISCLQL